MLKTEYLQLYEMFLVIYFVHLLCNMYYNICIIEYQFKEIYVYPVLLYEIKLCISILITNV